MAQASPEDKACRSNVGGQDGHEGKRGDVVQRNGRPNIDQGQEAGYNPGNHDGVHWNIPTRPDLYKSGSVHVLTQFARILLHMRTRKTEACLGHEQRTKADEKPLP